MLDGVFTSKTPLAPPLFHASPPTTDQDVATGLYAHFCGYDPARDPVHFGFPGETSRDIEG